METPNYLQDIADFHTAMGLPLFGLTGEALMENMKVRKRLVDEELLAEFFPAYAAYSKESSIDNLVTLIDAICDSVYVVGGTQLVYIQDATRWRLDIVSCAIASIMASVTDMYMLVFEYGESGGDICAKVCDRLYSYGIKLIGEDKFNSCWREVHRTNMLKADGPVVNGKKMKPPGWVGPDLKSIIEGESP